MSSSDRLPWMHPLFTSLESCIEVFVEEGLAVEFRTCSCESQMKLIIYSQGGNSRALYRCSSRLCRRKVPLLSICTKLSLNNYFFLMHMILLNNNYFQISEMADVSDATIASAGHTS